MGSHSQERGQDQNSLSHHIGGGALGGTATFRSEGPCACQRAPHLPPRSDRTSEGCGHLSRGLACPLGQHHCNRRLLSPHMELTSQGSPRRLRRFGETRGLGGEGHLLGESGAWPQSRGRKVPDSSALNCGLHSRGGACLHHVPERPQVNLCSVIGSETAMSWQAGVSTLVLCSLSKCGEGYREPTRQGDRGRPTVWGPSPPATPEGRTGSPPPQARGRNRAGGPLCQAEGNDPTP